jgi:hypothetical protein
MTERRIHTLHGLQPDNLMAFLALLGLLRSLDCARPDWHSRAGWSVDAPPLRPRLHVSAGIAQEEICAAATEGTRTLLSAVDLGDRKDIKLTAEEARTVLRQASEKASSGPAARFAADLLIALGSDAGREDGEEASTSPLCFPSVARTNFITSIREIVAAEAPTQRSGSSRNLGTAEQAIERALFQSWERQDRPPGLRWDPEEARLHAHQWTAPTDEKPTTEHGANRLALIGLSCFPVLPSSSNRKAQTPVPGTKNLNGTFSVSWPIWRWPMTLPAIRALMVSIARLAPAAREDLGVFAVMRSERVSLDRYISFTRASPESASP